MQKLLPFLVLACTAVHIAPASEQPGNHVDLTTAILSFMSRTELCLNACRDAESLKAAVPQLKELKAECDKLASIQRALPEPTIQDYMAVQKHMATFNTIWKAIRTHIERLEEEKIMTQEVRDILFIAPPDADTATPPIQ